MAAGSVTSRLIDAVVAAGPVPMLKAAGFRKAGRAFHRAVGGFFQVVQFQASQWNSPAAAQFTANLNVVQPFFHEAWAGRPFPANPASAAPVVSQRIGSLMPGRRDLWWDVTPTTDVGRLGAEVAGAVADYGLPFLADHTDIDRLIRDAQADWEAARPGLNRGLCQAILLASRGERSAARRVVREVARTNKLPAFADTIRIVAGRLGLPDAAEHRGASDTGSGIGGDSQGEGHD